MLVLAPGVRGHSETLWVPGGMARQGAAPPGQTVPVPEWGRAMGILARASRMGGWESSSRTSRMELKLSGR